MKTYEHFYTVGFVAISTDPTGATPDQIRYALESRMLTLGDDAELLDAVGEPDESFDIDTGKRVLSVVEIIARAKALPPAPLCGGGNCDCPKATP